MSIFHFKKFDVKNERSAMKVNTDGVLLGICAPMQPSDRQILDIGTGTGTAALVLAQRMNGAAMEDGAGFTGIDAMITGIDIDEDAAAEAGENFRESPWSGILTALHTPLSEYEPDSGFDLIVSNPPYYDDSLINQDARKATARHTGGGLSYREILAFAETRLNTGGRLCIILPADQERELLRYGRMHGLHPSNILRIKTVQRKAPSRIIVAFKAGEKPVPIEDSLTIMEKGSYTQQYLSLVKDFYLFA